MASVFKPAGKSEVRHRLPRRERQAPQEDRMHRQGDESRRIGNDLENQKALRRDGILSIARPKRTATTRPARSPNIWPTGMPRCWPGEDPPPRRTVPRPSRKSHRAGQGSGLAGIEPGRREEDRPQSAEDLGQGPEGCPALAPGPRADSGALALLLRCGEVRSDRNHSAPRSGRSASGSMATRRMRDNPMKGVAGYNVEEDIRHRRRALTDDELAAVDRGRRDRPRSCSGCPARSARSPTAWPPRPAFESPSCVA